MPDLSDVAPIFPVSDLDAALEHYEGLGFEVSSHDDGYGYVVRGGVTIHLAVVTGIEPLRSNSAAYVFVDDADALAEEWSAVAGTITDPVNTDYGLREGAHTDPDGNLIRFGSPLD